MFRKTALAVAALDAIATTEQRRNEVLQVQAEAEKACEEAQGQADARLIIAKAEAEAIRIRGEALRQNPVLVDLTAVERWNGVLPVTMMSSENGAVPFVNVPTAKQE